MIKDKDAFIVIAPTGSGKVFSIAARRMGSKDRYSIIGSTTNDIAADKIVKGLLLLQGEEVKLEVPAQRVLEEVRSQLTFERSANGGLRTQVRTLEIELANVKQRLRSTELERDAA
jgi:hypothetical protein